MKLELVRDTFNEGETFGILYIDGKPDCSTLEDKDRELENGGVKIPAETAIPCGAYQVILDYSQRFKRVLPHVLNVPQFVGIRIHPGNTKEDTEGCILPGLGRAPHSVTNSRVAFNRIFDKIEVAYDKGEPIELVVRRKD